MKVNLIKLRRQKVMDHVGKNSIYYKINKGRDF